MFKRVLFKGLFRRLLGAGVHPIIAGELSSANYPSRRFSPKQAPLISTAQINSITEQFLDDKIISIEDAWLEIWGVSIAQYFQVDSEQ